MATPLQKTQGFPITQCHYHAAPELAKNAQTCWRRRLMIMTLDNRLAKGERKIKRRKDKTYSTELKK